jgi:uncharacterized protein DUF6356
MDFSILPFATQSLQAVSCRNPYTCLMLRRFTDHPSAVNETYFQHMGMAFGFGGRMLLGGLACLVHGLFPWLCTTRGSDTIRGLHHRMVSHRVVRPAEAGIVPAE